ncbi:MAG: right-handed parallel beta-helix repeat-containing protein [Armatimonadota bacterium]|nr:right-handed parallel beta-helix repeat-containing protein [Armatimonadota bacterium]
MKAFGIAICIGVVVMLAPRSGAQPAAEGVELHVAAKGSDEAPGTRAQPFATLERARDAIREMKAAEGLPDGGVTVWLRGGLHRLEGPFELTEEDSGTEGAPIVYRARPGESTILSGGVRVPPSAFGPVTDTAVLGRLPRAAQNNVLRADLKALGVEDYGSAAGGGLEVFFGEERMTLARWPNEGFVRIADILGIEPRDVRGTKGDSVGKFVYEGDRPERWVGERDLWLHGYWFWDWADQRQPVKEIDPEERTIELEEPYHHYGYRKGQWYYAYNALAELDRPGEWYLGREDGILYFWPPGDLDARTLTVSVVDNLITVEDASYLTFRGLTLEAPRDTGIRISGGSHNSIIGCTFRDTGGFAARLSGTNHRVAHCDAYHMGQGGFTISGGDRKTLTPAHNLVENCHIHHFGEWKRMYVPGVSVHGVGNRVAHNLIHTAPHQAISFGGNDHIIELNEFHSVCYESNDAGAIYSGRNWTMRGTVIRHNYMHHVNGRGGHGCVGVYLDDMYCGTEISGNVFYRVYRAAFIGGGRDNSILNNLFVECPRAIHIDARAMGWAAGSVDTTMTDRLNEMPYQSDLWRERYPKLINILDDEPAAPKGNLVARNIIIGPYPWRDIQSTADPFQTLEDNVVLEDVGEADFVEATETKLRLLDSSPDVGIDFEPVPFAEMGLYEHEDRPTWPVRHQVKQSVLQTWRERQEAGLRRQQERERARGPRPEHAIVPCAAEITIDGRLRKHEWMGLRREAGIAIKEGIYGEPTSPPSFAWLCHDGDSLKVAIDNRVDASKPLRTGDDWGSDDAVEIALRHPAGHIIVLRGYPSGHFESSDEAGAPQEAVSRAGQGVQYAAAVVSEGRWTCEWEIPFASLGIEPEPELRLNFNISVRKSAQPLWQMWRGTGAHTWDVDTGGIVRFVP